MSEEQRPDKPVWIKAVLIQHKLSWGKFPVEKLIILSPEGEEMWDWLIWPEDVAWVERE